MATSMKNICPTCGQEMPDTPYHGAEQHPANPAQDIGVHPDHSPDALQRRVGLGSGGVDAWRPQDTVF
jgi:hypothetical protein